MHLLSSRGLDSDLVQQRADYAKFEPWGDGRLKKGSFMAGINIAKGVWKLKGYKPWCTLFMSSTAKVPNLLPLEHVVQTNQCMQLHQRAVRKDRTPSVQ